MALIIGIGVRRRRKGGGRPPSFSSYLLTAAGNKICTPTGNKIKLVTSS